MDGRQDNQHEEAVEILRVSKRHIKRVPRDEETVLLRAEKFSKTRKAKKNVIHQHITFKHIMNY
jgi:hypothetical protein